MTIIHNITSINNITIETSTLCNARCKICPNETNPRKPHFMSLEDFKIILQLFPNLNEVSLCGMYEPLLDSRLPNILDIIKKVNSNMKIAIFTNASLLHKWEDLLIENISDIVFSVHGFTSESYNSIMKGLDRDKTYENIINFCKKIKSKQSKIKTNIAFVRTSLNLNELNDYISFWSKYTDIVSNYELMNWNGNVLNYKSLLDKPKKIIRPCPMFSNPLVIDAFGNVTRCCYNLKFSYGHVTKDGINNWLSKKRISDIYPDTDCFKCDGWRF